MLGSTIRKIGNTSTKVPTTSQKKAVGRSRRFWRGAKAREFRAGIVRCFEMRAVKEIDDHCAQKGAQHLSTKVHRNLAPGECIPLGDCNRNRDCRIEVCAAELLDAEHAHETAMPQPKVMTIQPEPWPLVFPRTTLATTPLPSTIRRAVPTNSSMNGVT